MSTSAAASSVTTIVLSSVPATPSSGTSAASVLEVSTKIRNVEFTQELGNRESNQFQEFEKNFTADVVNGFSKTFQDSYQNGQIKINVTSIENGCILVNFTVAVSTNVSVTTASIREALIESLNNSQKFDVDLQNTTIVGKEF
ncbi:hypothetical protein scyTo_0019501 [Scyliorhinus torazame]|uniref:SEA domain-containing protein n=1 Tax=Scyliorhinus torazame TaxID=75743 RepID=A0A401Q1E0_SCYTO|nr:hypothetical protein [Scyliorhinus torazame]